MSNVLKFPTDPASGKGVKAYAILLYLLLAFTMISPAVVFTIAGKLPYPVKHPFALSGDILGLLLALGTLYGLVVKQWYKRATILRSKPWLNILFGFLLLMTVLRYLPQLGLLAFFYWLFVARSGRETPYFLRFHILTALIANGLLALPLLLLQSVVGLADALSRLGGMDWFVSVMYWYGFVWPCVVALSVWGLAIWLSFSVIMGRTPYIPTVTDNVRHWA